MAIRAEGDLKVQSVTADRSALRSEQYIFVVLLASIAFGILLLFIGRPALSATFLEYDIKFVPVFFDRGLSAIFDGHMLGDPRTRIIANFFGYLNVIIREKLLAYGVIPPALSIAWLIYPTTLVMFGAAVRRLSKSSRASKIAVVLLASSPAMLDIFVNYYIPAKPLALFFFVSALYGGALFVPDGTSPPRPIFGACVLATSQLLGFLCDETAIFIALCVPIILAPDLLTRDLWNRDRLIFLSALLASSLTYAALAIFALPFINRLLGQVPVDLVALVSNGVYETMFGAEKTSLWSLISAGYSPVGLGMTILGAHLFPLTKAAASWTTEGPPLWGVQYLYLLIVGWLAIGITANVRGRARVLTGSILAAFLVFILVEAAVILRLAPNITEVNYYANFTSPLMALLIAVPLAAWSERSATSASASIMTWLRRRSVRNKPNILMWELARLVQRASAQWVPFVQIRSSQARILSAWTITAGLSVIQFTNFLYTANRHPMFLSGQPVSWSQLKEAYTEAREGRFVEWSKAHPFPDRLFVWGLEAALGEHHRRGRLTDLQPFLKEQDTPLAQLNFQKMADPQIAPMDHPMLTGRAEFESAKAQPQKLTIVSELLRSGYDLRGRAGEWGLIWRQNDHEEIQQFSWHYGLIRIWYSRGRLDHTGSELCPRFLNSPPCFQHLYKLDDFLFGTDENGKTVIVLKIERKPSGR